MIFCFVFDQAKMKAKVLRQLHSNQTYIKCNIDLQAYGKMRFRLNRIKQIPHDNRSNDSSSSRR